MSMPPVTFTAQIETSEGNIREFHVYSSDGLLSPVLPAINQNVKDGEQLLNVLDPHGGGISLC